MHVPINISSFVGLQTIAYLHNVKYICISGDVHVYLM